MKFKNVIFYHTTAPKSIEFRQKLSKIQYIRIFEPETIDEVQQIIDMSERSVILADDELKAQKIAGATLHKTYASFKKYFMDWNQSISPDGWSKLKENGFVLINSDEDEIVELIELYLFGKSDVFKDPVRAPKIAPTPTLFRLGYFTHLEKKEGGWKTLVTTHDPVDEIDDILGLDWRQQLRQTMDDARYLKGPADRRLYSGPYHEVVYPHFAGNELRRLSIVHLNVDSDHATRILKVFDFLSKIRV